MDNPYPLPNIPPRLFQSLTTDYRVFYRAPTDFPTLFQLRLLADGIRVAEGKFQLNV